MIEIRFHGRGGQGAVVASNILANAAFKEGKDVQSFPYFGVERRGSPVTAFTRISDSPILVRSQIYEPNHVIVMDAALLNNISADILSGLKKNGTLLVNTKDDGLKMKKYTIPDGVKVFVVNATETALKHGLGTRVFPIVNTAVLGAFVKVSGIVKIDSVLESIRESVPSNIENNVAAARESYDSVKHARIEN